jgi:hypothetical protein
MVFVLGCSTPAALEGSTAPGGSPEFVDARAEWKGRLSRALARGLLCGALAVMVRLLSCVSCPNLASGDIPDRSIRQFARCVWLLP